MPLSGLPIRSTAFAVLLVVLHKRSVLRVPSLLLNLYLLLVILNLVNVPGGWHWRVFVTPIARIRLQQLRAKLGLHSGKGSRAKELGIDPKYYHLKSIGIAPQAGTTWLQKRVTIGDSDIFMHLNNACYNNVTDMGSPSPLSSYIQHHG